jgi:hypothetical protein
VCNTGWCDVSAFWIVMRPCCCYRKHTSIRDISTPRPGRCGLFLAACSTAEFAGHFD